MKTSRHQLGPTDQLTAILAFLAVFASSGIAQADQLFYDDLSSGANWTVKQTPDSSAEFGYDYSQKGLPPAPGGSSDTIGLKFEVNNSPPGSEEQIIAYNSNASFTGKYTVRADVWINWALVNGGPGTGTTEYAGVSVGHDGSGPTLSGATLVFDGDGGVDGFDYHLYQGNDAALLRGHAFPPIAQAFPPVDIASTAPSQGQSGVTLAGAGGFQWMTLNVEVDTTSLGPAGLDGDLGFARFSMRSAASGKTVEIGIVDNSRAGPPVALSNGIALQLIDIYPSVTTNPAFSFAIFDNVRVLEGLIPIPEPSSGTLLMIAVASPWRRGRRATS